MGRRKGSACRTFPLPRILVLGGGAVTAIQPRAEADDRRALLDGHGKVLRGAHGEVPQAVLAGELRQRAEVGTAVLGAGGGRRHRHQPDDGHGAACDERPQLAGVDPGLAGLAGDVDLHEDLRAGGPVASELLERGVAGHGVDELDAPDDLADLAALELTDEVPAERRRPAQAAAFSSSCCARFSPSTVTPASASADSSSVARYLTAASSSTPAGSRPARAQAASISARTGPASTVRPATRRRPGGRSPRGRGGG